MSFRWLLSLFTFWVFVSAAVFATPVINEFVASNSGGHADEDGDFSDWVELHNPTATTVDLNGWHLTDNAGNLTKWRFPAVTIPADGYLLVYASNKNRRTPGEPLHTNFALSAGGEFLGLVAPDGVTVVSAFAPEYPPQSRDISYGFPSNVTTGTLVEPNSSCKWIVPSSASNPDETWRNIGFNDASWNSAVQGIGYDRNVSGVNFNPEIGIGGNTETAMHNILQSCYVRIPFTVGNPADVLALRLKLKFDDGFVAYLNGQPLLSNGTALRRNAPSDPAWDSGATQTNEDGAAIQWAEFNVSSSVPGLVAGQNVLSFQVLNRFVTSSDLLFRAELTADLVVSGSQQEPGYFGTATPGARNRGEQDLVIPQEVSFSAAEGTFINNFNLVLGGAISGQEIRYTTNGTVPTISSTLYTGAIPITATTWVRARIFDTSNGSASLPYGAGYEKLMASLSSYGSTGIPFRSSLPILVLNNRGGGEIANDNTYRDARLHLFDRNESGYSSIAGASSLSAAVAVKLRGSSSASFDKKSYSLEFRTEAGGDRSVSILGMPADGNWALISCDDFDPSFMRNAWIYEAGRRTGRWSPRTRFVELFFNQNGNNLGFMEVANGTTDYRGVYVLCENIRNGADRADITKLETSDTVQPNLSGGYLFKVDRAENDEYSWRTTRNLPNTSQGGILTIHRPKLADLTTEQTTYLRTYFQAFEDAVYADATGGFSTRNYRNHIDTATWVDHNIFNMFPKNVDGLRLSAFFLKDRGRRIEGGPLWDFDRSANSTDSRDNAFDTWIGTGDATNYFTYGWWNQLFQDIEFRQAYVDRWQELRAGILRTEEIHGIIDGFFAEFKSTDADHPARRDYARWYGGPTNKDFAGEVSLLRNWVEDRADWIDDQFTAPPMVNVPEGIVNAGQSVTLGVPSGTTVYYRLDGLDPRAEGGTVRPGAVTYSGGAIVLNETTRLTARAWRAGSYAIPATNWSGMVSPLYLVSESYANAEDLRVTALHYNPLGPDQAELLEMPELHSSDFEWIEVMNAGTGPLNLDGVTLVSGQPVSELVLPPFTLAPGERGVVVKNRAAFLLRHPDREGRVVAEWRGDKSLSNDGERIHLLDRDGLTIAWFEYEDGGNWPSRADGDGGALEFTGASHGTLEYETASNWRTSAEIHGMPGQGGSGPRDRVQINEVLAASVWPQLDAVEIYNPGVHPVDLSGWYLSNTPGALTVSDYQRFRIPDGTVLPAGGFLVFTEEDFNPNGSWNGSGGEATEQEFSLDGFRGGRVWLISADPGTGKLDAFEDHADFTPATPGTSLGRWPDGADRFILLEEVTMFGLTGQPFAAAGSANSGPKLGDVQISEVMYHPVSGSAEYLEIVNTGTTAESLDQWTLRGDVDYYFGPGDALAAGESVLIVPFDPINSPSVAESLRMHYQIDPVVRLIGPWSFGNTLDNSAGEIRLRRKIEAPQDDPLWVGLMLEDEVIYQNQSPWPAGSSGTGSAIHRLGIARWGNDPTAWISSAPTPGSDAGGYAGWQRHHFPLGGPLSGPGDDADGDGVPNQMEYLLGLNPTRAEALPILNFIDNSVPQAALVMEYRIRRDRGDVAYSPKTSTVLEDWIEAEDDRFEGWDGLYEIRRTHLPMNAGRGFIRLEIP